MRGRAASRSSTFVVVGEKNKTDEKFIKTEVAIIVPIFMRLAGFLFLFSGWLIVLAAVTLLKSAALSGFVLTGFAVQLLGLTLVVRTHVIPHGEKR